MKRILVTCILSLVTVGAGAHEADATGKAKAAELAAHRIDRLVSLNKIDASFNTKISKIEVSLITNAAPAYYRVLVSQTTPAQGTPLQVELLEDELGKALSFKVIPGVTGPDPQWPEKDAVSLIENSLHYVLDNSAKADVAPYFKDMTSVTISRNTYKGQTVAVGTITSSSTAQKMYVYLKLDGTLVAAQTAP
jgi:hypothetical protein